MNSVKVRLFHDFYYCFSKGCGIGRVSPQRKYEGREILVSKLLLPADELSMPLCLL